MATPSLGPVGAFFATFSSDRLSSMQSRCLPRAPDGRGTFLIFLFFHWLFLEERILRAAGRALHRLKGVWFFAVVSILLAVLVWIALGRNPMIAFGGVMGSTAFFIVHGFRQNARSRSGR
jgi:hypothetical protein